MTQRRTTAGPGRRRRIPAWVLVLLFVAVPLLEIYVIIQVGQVIGAWWTILLLIADSIVGAWLLKREGARAWQALQVALKSGRMPSRELADGALILIGGTLMLTPGFVSDAAGLFFVAPFTRPIARRALTRVVAQRLTIQTFPGTPPDARHPGPVVRGEVVDPED